MLSVVRQKDVIINILYFFLSQELNVPLLKVAGPEIVAGISGESEARIRELFEQALAIAPCVIFLDEIDVVAINRATAQKEMEKRIVAQLLSCLDGKTLLLCLTYYYYCINSYVWFLSIRPESQGKRRQSIDDWRNESTRLAGSRFAKGGTF